MAEIEDHAVELDRRERTADFAQHRRRIRGFTARQPQELGAVIVVVAVIVSAAAMVVVVLFAVSEIKRQRFLLILVLAADRQHRVVAVGADLDLFGLDDEFVKGRRGLGKRVAAEPEAERKLFAEIGVIAEFMADARQRLVEGRDPRLACAGGARGTVFSLQIDDPLLVIGDRGDQRVARLQLRQRVELEHRDRDRIGRAHPAAQTVVLRRLRREEVENLVGAEQMMIVKQLTERRAQFPASELRTVPAQRQLRREDRGRDECGEPVPGNEDLLVDLPGVRRHRKRPAGEKILPVPAMAVVVDEEPFVRLETRVDPLFPGCGAAAAEPGEQLVDRKPVPECSERGVEFGVCKRFFGGWFHWIPPES